MWTDQQKSAMTTEADALRQELANGRKGPMVKWWSSNAGGSDIAELSLKIAVSGLPSDQSTAKLEMLLTLLLLACITSHALRPGMAPSRAKDKKCVSPHVKDWRCPVGFGDAPRK